MKICFVSKHYYPFAGGLESRVVSLSEWLVGRGYGVSVLTSLETGTVGEEVVNGVRVYRCRHFFSLFNAPFTPSVLLRLLSLDYDLVDINLPDPVNSIFVLLACLLRRKPFTVTYHADIVKDEWYHIPFRVVYGIFLNLVLSGAERIFVTSPNYVDSSAVLGRFRGKTVIAPSFVDTGRFSPKVDGSDILERHRLKNRKVVLFVGRLVPYKGLDYLVDAFSRLSLEIDSALLIVGEGPLEKQLKSRVAELRMDNVFFEGSVSDKLLAQYYAACDVFVLPSITRQEAFGLVLVEAMACGKPVVSTNFSGMPYVVDDAGILVEPRDVLALKDALLKILSDSKRSAGFAARGRKRVEDFFSRDVVCNRILDVFKEISRIK